MKLSDLLCDIHILESNVDLSMEISGVSYDSRKTAAGHLFVAVTGYAMDGHRFIPAALDRGAACVLCGELSLLAAQTNPGELMAAHLRLERAGK